jgi:hypothetical protein
MHGPQIISGFLEIIGVRAKNEIGVRAKIAFNIPK